MIPSSYFFKAIYRHRWIEPSRDTTESERRETMTGRARMIWVSRIVAAFRSLCLELFSGRSAARRH